MMQMHLANNLGESKSIIIIYLQSLTSLISLGTNGNFHTHDAYFPSFFS